MLVPVSRFALMPDSQHTDEVRLQIVPVEREVTRRAMRDHELSAQPVHAASYARVRREDQNGAANLR